MIKNILITGATRGIGKAAAELFCKKGQNVIIFYKESDKNAEKLKNLYPENLTAIKCDVSKSNEVKKAFEFIEEKFKGLDILINNAGKSSQKMLCDVTEEEWDNIFDTNIKGMFNTVKCAMPYMIHQKKGAIINISSIWGICGASCETVYSASKAAVIGFTKALAKELGPSNIRVNCIAPGVIDTDMNSHLDSETIEELKNSTPLCRIGKPEEIAKVIEFLSGDSSSFITGQVITADGGFTLQ